MNLCCSWYRQGQPEPIEGAKTTVVENGVMTTLSLKPDKVDDGAVFKCMVWNRAMPSGAKLESTVSLNVNCKYHICSYTMYGAYDT